MKQFLTYILCCAFGVIFSQDKPALSTYFDVNYFKGNIALHNDDILHLITGHPEGVIVSWNKKTFGQEAWEQRFNYPDYGVSFIYQNLKNDVLGNNYSMYGHYNFYFLRRHAFFRIGQGLAFTTNPYDKISNHKNIAFGSKFMSSTYVMLNYKKERIIDRFGLQAGLSFIHYSNANVKAPNTSINSITLNIGITYNFDEENPEYIVSEPKEKFIESFKYNVVFRSGTDVFFSNFLNELIYYKSVAFPEEEVSGEEDYKRVGIFLGHELFINRLSLVTQLGYYVYYPYDFEGRTYFRVGLKRYFGKKWFGVLTLKSHGARAEAVEFGVGVNLVLVLDYKYLSFRT
jgi:hypothetical protein